ncbi:unnamed protein product, partial [Strongylus vulgaris]
MASWPHIIAVGTHFAHCYLLHFQLAEQNAENGHAPVTVKLTDGPFHSGNDLVYTSVDPCTGHSFSKKLPLETVHVTCISFLEKSRTILVGFSFGGIMTISLTTSPTIDPLMYPCGAAVKFIATLEPDDDPRSHLWFFVAYGTTKAKPLQLALYEVMFPDEEALPLNERTWNKPVFAIKLVIPFHNSTRWVSAQTLVRDRAELRSNDDSTRDSFKFGSDKDRSLMFFSYIGKDRHGNSLKGGLFDLNAYYYKRLVQVIAHDGTAAQQCAFLSTVHPIPISHKEKDYSLVKDVAVDTSCITRFVSNISDADQMFYPSAFEIGVVHVAGAKKCYQLTLPSLPNQMKSFRIKLKLYSQIASSIVEVSTLPVFVYQGIELLSTICADLEMHITDATSASAWLTALGFPRKQVGGTEQYANLCYILHTLISHQRGISIVHFIKHSESTELRHLIASWIWEEVDRASKKMHETIEPLFARFSAPLSPTGQKSLAHVHDVFVAGVQILRELISTGEREQDQTKEYITSLEAQRFATENLKSYSSVIHQLIRSRILPVAEDREIRLAMEEALEERRVKASGQQLYIDKLVTRMQRKSPGEPFWLAEGLKWYPPALLNLLGPILLLNIPAKWKGQLLAYYLFDYTNCKKVNGNIPCSPFDLFDHVTKQMHGLLGMKKEELWSLYKFWRADAGMPLSENEENEQCSPRKRLSHDVEIKQIMSIPRPLTLAEEEKLQSLLKSVRYGEFVWQCYLARCKKFDEFKELIVPSNESNEFILEYQQLLPVVRMLRRSKRLSPLTQISWPSEMKQTIENFEQEWRSSLGWYDTGIPIPSRGKTPKSLNIKRQYNTDGLLSRKRNATTTLQQMNLTSPQTSTESDKTTSTAKRALLDFSEDDTTSLPKNIPATTLNTITDILRTPQARARAAAQAESQRKWIEKTPEAEFQKPVPRSILKSARAASERAASPSRNRLQFDLPSSSQSSVVQTSPSSTGPEQLDKMAQPNFDESFDYDENLESSATAEECVVVEPEEFAPYVSPSSSVEILEEPVATRDSDSVLERSIEVQDEEESDADMEEVDGSAVTVEEQDDEEDGLEAQEPEEIAVLKAVGQQLKRKNKEMYVSHPVIEELVEEPVEEQHIEQQDEEEEIDECEKVHPSKNIVHYVAVEQQEEEEGGSNPAPVVETVSEQIEKQDEEEQFVDERLSYIEQEEQDDDDSPMFASPSNLESSSSYKSQDGGLQAPAINKICYESIIERTSDNATIAEPTANGDEGVGHVTRSIRIQSQFDDEVEITEVHDEYDEDAAVLASGDYATPTERIQSVTVPSNLNGGTSTDGHIKLVDYSLHESTFESTPNPTKSQK